MSNTRSSDLPITVLHECFEPNFVCGELTWKARPLTHFRTERAQHAWNGRFPGKKAGSPGREGRWFIDISTTSGKRVRTTVHSVLLAMRDGVWPALEVDHANGNPSQSWLCNLRLASHSDNLANQKRRSDNSSGFKGVFLHKPGAWRACITKRGKRHYLGIYSTPQEAHASYKAAAVKLFGEFARWE